MEKKCYLNIKFQENMALIGSYNIFKKEKSFECPFFK